MPWFRKKPVEIEAVQLLWTTWDEVCEFVSVGKEHDEDGKATCRGVWIKPDGSWTDEPQGETGRLGLLIPTPEGTMCATEGDWIISGVHGELYPCKPSIFEATYEPSDRPTDRLSR